ncbi:hypothetical protein V6U81_06550 [Micromonospora sp. CPCC 205711]|uniref:hypothetical protein n=1 Tax=Micromonospora sp. CPCC 205547 TaxID=3122400 RepID=UPI002FF1B65E
MSSPPVDPWSAQPEHGPPHAPHPQPYGGQPAPPPSGEWPTASYPTTPTPQGGGWGPAPAPGGHPADPYPTQPYGGYPSQGHPGPGPDATQPYGGYPSPGHPGPGPDATQAYPGFQGAPFGAPVGPPPAPAPKKSRLPLILSLALAGLLVLCVGGGGLVFAAFSGDDDDPAPLASGGPSASRGATPAETATAAPTPSETEETLGRVRLVTPKTLAGRAKSTEPELRRLADQMNRDMRSTVRNETGAMSGFYGSAEKRNLVMVAGASGPVILPEQELDEAIDGLETTLAVKKMTAISPGPLGGVAKCGDGKAAGIALGVCVWADHGSVGMIIMYFSSARKAKAEFVTIRGQIEKRS